MTDGQILHISLTTGHWTDTHFWFATTTTVFMNIVNDFSENLTYLLFLFPKDTFFIVNVINTWQFEKHQCIFHRLNKLVFPTFFVPGNKLAVTRETESDANGKHYYYTQLDTATCGDIDALSAAFITLIGMVQCAVPAPARLASMCLTDDQLQVQVVKRKCQICSLLLIKTNHH